MMDDQRIPKIVITGGPCAGKSTGLERLIQKLPEFGITPFIVPEVAAMVLTSGVKIGDILKDPELYFQLELGTLLTQLSLEERWEHFARVQPGKRKVLLCDRGAMDVSAYMDPPSFERLLEELKYSVTNLRDVRYDAVRHLVTAANGAENFYNLNNPARFESPEEARIRDGATLAAWVGHRNLKIIRNDEIIGGVRKKVDFEAKIQKLLEEVCNVLGIPAPLQISRRFLLGDATNPSALLVPNTSFEVTQDYLTSPDPALKRRVRVRRQIGTGKYDALYTYGEKRKLHAGVSQKTGRVITADEYSSLLATRDPNSHTIKKTRCAFTYELQYFQVDVFHAPRQLVILEVDLTQERDEILLPPFLHVLREVTDDDSYSNAAIASALAH